MLTKDQIIQAPDLPHVDVDVPEWGGVVRLRAMSGGERDRYDQWHHANKPKEPGAPINHIRAALIAFTACDETGALMFTEADIQIISGKNGTALDRLFDEANKLTRIDTEQELKN